MRLSSLLVLSLLTLSSVAQDRTIRLMTYNLLNYRNTTSYCTGSNNSSSSKEGHLETIIDEIAPHAVVLNEIGSNPNNLTYLLNNAFNTGTTTHWAMANHVHNGFSSLVNGVAYRNDILGIANQWAITKDADNNSLVRAIDIVRFYYKDALLQGNSDTATFVVIGAHFKAGNTSSDAAERNKAATAIIDWIDAHNFDNIFLLGDLNTYTSNEASFQSLIGGNSFRFEDPITSNGNWHNNSSFASIHTQSTRTSGNCHSGGGLDDRFDHILCSEEVIEGDAQITYSPNSYFAVGNDGNHFNNAINSGTNYSVSSAVLSALYALSDHLPVIIDVEIEGQQLAIESHEGDWTLPNPMQPGTTVSLPLNSRLIISNLAGQQLFETTETHFQVPILSKGTYLLQLKSEYGQTTRKIIF
ncbi:MAG: T9SS type A sorting domain-containing protein [Schleiferiaceae bacterium]|nr:T9SS type A sorting domain-containing protein [Schleiferiaceae bacterium]